MRKFIFLWFLVSALLLSGLFGLGAFWTGHSIFLAALSFYGSNVVHYSAQTAALALDEGGLPALTATEQRIDPDGKTRFFVFDSSLNEISGGPCPDPIRAFAARLRPQDDAQFDFFHNRFIAGSIVPSHRGGAYRVVIWFALRRVPYVPINTWGWIVRIGAIIVVAALLCSWLGWRLSVPLARLRQAARRFASGDLGARAEASTFPSAPPEYKELARDFDEMAGRIETLVDSQRRLLRDVSHELRSPLTRLSLAVNNARHAPAAAVEGSLDRIDQESERLNALIERIMCLSRFEVLGEPPHRDVIEFADFIESIVSDADFEASARKRGVAIVRAETCRLTGDRELLREAIENIVRNAIRYTPEGTTVTVEAWRKGSGEYCVAVRDSGPGVPREHLEAIFQPFYRAPQSSDQEKPGFGIGLAIAHRAVNLHEGTITARNLVPGGFEIAIHLPVSAKEVQADACRS
jgi:two-component system sensor histidine kinase CpxA